MMSKLISIITPIFNEEKNIILLYNKLISVFKSLNQENFELIFINDGSKDNSQKIIEQLSSQDNKIKFLEFSRNFGKEIATTAGLNYSKGDAAIMIDADLQHPVELIPEFIKKWQQGSKVVVGVRNKNKSDKLSKKIGSWLFYKIMANISETDIMPNSTDFRLLDRQVINEFNKLTEKNRMMRGLIDWLGFKQDYIYFNAIERKNGKPGYNFYRLTRLAFSSFVSLSLFPLKLAGYLGIFITLSSVIVGIYMFTTNYILKIQNFTGPAILAIMNLFLIGIVLSCLGLIALYIANIDLEVTNRPMYIINSKKL